MNKILITGGAGGIGSTLGKKLLELGHKVLSVDNFHNGYLENLSTTNYDYSVSNPIIETVIRAHGIGCVIHMAAISSLPECEEFPSNCYMTNTMGTLNILECARKCGVNNVVFASTSAVYENNTESPFKEDMVVAPLLNYSLSKKLAEDICWTYIKKYGMNISILRLFNVFGPRQDIHRKSPPLINYIVKEIVRGNQPVLHSDGNQRRDYISIDKVCEAIIKLMEKETPSEVYNICGGKTFSVREVYGIVSKVLSFNWPAIYDKAEDLWKDYDIKIDKKIVAKETNKFSCGSSEKAAKDLGMSFDEDTEKLIANTALEMQGFTVIKYEQVYS